MLLQTTKLGRLTPKAKQQQTITPPGQPPAPPPQQLLTDVDPAKALEGKPDYKKLAEDEAKKWKSDAVLHLVSIKVSLDLTVNTSTETYVFGGNTVPDDWWTISISERDGKFVRAIIPKEDYLGYSIQPLKLDFLKTNDIQAFQAGEKHGGKDFRTIHKNVNITLNLFQGPPNDFLWWNVEYQSLDGGSLRIRINANTGEAVDDQGNPLPSGKPPAQPTQKPQP